MASSTLLPVPTTPVGFLRDQGGIADQIGVTTPSRPVGLLRCQADPLLRQLFTTLVAVRPAPKAPAPASKKSKSQSSSSNDQSVDLHVLLADTIIFPEGGGQPADHGTLTIAGHELPVVDAIRFGLDAVHVVKVPKSLNPSQVLQPGSPVLVRVDWARRTDHMDQHTGQHLLSAALEHLEQPIPTLSWSLTTAPSPCYVELPRAPTVAELAQVQVQIDAHIKANTSVHVEIAAMEQAPRPEKLPEDYAHAGEAHAVNSQGVVRTVVMDGYDHNPCCGTHYPTLGSLRLLHILPGTSKVRGTNVRLYFAVGQRAIDELVSTFNTATDLSRSLECARPEAVGRLDQLIQREKAVRKREARLKEEVGSKISSVLVGMVVTQIPPGLLRDRLEVCKRLPSESITMEGPTTYDLCPGHLCVAAEIYRPDADSEMVSCILKGIESQYAREPRAHTLLLAIRTGPSDRDDPVPGLTAGLTVKAFASSRPDINQSTPQQVAGMLLAKFNEKLRSSSIFTGRLKGGGKGQWQGKLINRESEPFARWTSQEANEVHNLIQNASQEW